MADDARWYVVHTYSGYENIVAENIGKIVENRKMQDKILGVMIPMEKVVEVKDDKTVETERKLFPGYVVVKLAVEYDDDNQPQVPNETWHAIRYTRGCTGFVGPESKPVPLTEAEVQKLGIEKKSVEVTYKEGDLVTVTSGPFEGFSGVVEMLDAEKNVVRVAISMFGRETPVEFELDQVESAVE
ncbi:MAG: transcription termination/antitermination protein NusG [Oscillospiraceae bacterium]|nr:transcription termination/antitermination protein NusG [Oscillospiraceae bacterium]MDD7470450.1 transcription termination/antitermination protein NusG [Oscillospiraceae bacterium]MDO4397282.1 transcription termination/antitermination protein NusG [Oscillospiraceae bacterium]MDY2678450.1 transcription termination/antitermination protein NusG [Oscillospiraceae bacterium]